VLESIVKNCGSIVHVDVATRDFMDFMKDQAKVSEFIPSFYLTIFIIILNTIYPTSNTLY